MKTFSFVITAAICLLLAGFAQAANKDNKNGTIADDAHGIVWLKNVNCLGWSGWWTAETKVASLQSGICGLSDKSTAGQWRLPTPKELASRAVDTSGFSRIMPGLYWTSLSMGEKDAYVVLFPSGYLRDYQKGNGDGYIWPVRNK